jgi:predicted TIM-barrel fold metal-dependent hydrolase
MVIDGHCHAGTGQRLTAPWNTEARLRPYLRRARAAGIERTVLVPLAPHGRYERANREVAAIAAGDPRRFLWFAAVHPSRDEGRIRAMVAEAVRELGARGLKVHRMDAPLTREVCEAARRFGLPILYDVAGSTGLIEMAAPQYPDVAFVVPHLGSFGDDWRAHVAVIDQLVRFPNVFADTSGVRGFDYLEEAIRRAGARKIIFASDGPQLHPGLELHKIRLLRLDPADEALVLGGNIARLLRGSRRRAVGLRWPQASGSRTRRRRRAPTPVGTRRRVA